MAAYFLPGLPRPTINQGEASFFISFDSDVDKEAEEEGEEQLWMVIMRGEKEEEQREVKGLEKRHPRKGNFIDETQQPQMFIFSNPRTKNRGSYVMLGEEGKKESLRNG